MIDTEIKISLKRLTKVARLVSTVFSGREEKNGNEWQVYYHGPPYNLYVYLRGLSQPHFRENSKIAFVLASDPPREGQNGLLLGARISSNEINYSQDLVDGCSVVTFPDLEPTEKNTFVITSADYCNRDGESLKYNQEFLLTLSKSVNKKVTFNISGL